MESSIKVSTSDCDNDRQLEMARYYPQNSYVSIYGCCSVAVAWRRFCRPYNGQIILKYLTFAVWISILTVVVPFAES